MVGRAGGGPRLPGGSRASSLLTSGASDIGRGAALPAPAPGRFCAGGGGIFAEGGGAVVVCGGGVAVGLGGMTHFPGGGGKAAEAPAGLAPPGFGDFGGGILGPPPPAGDTGLGDVGGGFAAPAPPPGTDKALGGILAPGAAFGGGGPPRPPGFGFSSGLGARPGLGCASSWACRTVCVCGEGGGAVK